jgi:hypothetical protein
MAQEALQEGQEGVKRGRAATTPSGCVHPYVYQWSGRCEGCRLTPLSKSLPDHYAMRRLREVHERHEDAA